MDLLQGEVDLNDEFSKLIFEEETRYLTNEKLLFSRNWFINLLEYPIIDVTFKSEGRISFRVIMNCNNYNEKPPSIQLLKEDKTYHDKFPSGNTFFNAGAHPTTHRPFICSAGALEYHTHPSHTGDFWENYKGKPDYTLGSLLTKIWRAWQTTND